MCNGNCRNRLFDSGCVLPARSRTNARKCKHSQIGSTASLYRVSISNIWRFHVLVFVQSRPTPLLSMHKLPHICVSVRLAEHARLSLFIKRAHHHASHDRIYMPSCRCILAEQCGKAPCKPYFCGCAVAFLVHRRVETPPPSGQRWFVRFVHKPIIILVWEWRQCVFYTFIYVLLLTGWTWHCSTHSLKSYMHIWLLYVSRYDDLCLVRSVT